MIAHEEKGTADIGDTLGDEIFVPGEGHLLLIFESVWLVQFKD